MFHDNAKPIAALGGCTHNAPPYTYPSNGGGFVTVVAGLALLALALFYILAKEAPASKKDEEKQKLLTGPALRKALPAPPTACDEGAYYYYDDDDDDETEHPEVTEEQVYQMLGGVALVEE